jgi:hypothetical protein
MCVIWGMSEPIRTSAARRKQLAAALKRNMARRKAVASHPSPIASEGSLATPLAEVKLPSRFAGEGMLSHPAATTATRKGSAA